MNKKTAADFAHIKGWGVDADPENDPTYPMKDRSDAEQTGYSWERPTQQPIDMEILQSIERPNISAVFGTSSAPSGLSGVIRRLAYKYSESDYRHWLPLLLADRVNMVEGVLGDFAHGRVPNIWKEKGYDAEWKHNPQQLVTKLAVTALGFAGIIALIASSGKSKKNRYGSRPTNPRIRSAARG